ncbi:hypothetical protein [Bosea sp. AK1]|uniref:hypothetical protein n=1 Tax=Bosea sp. AK1 TaxID=2587160 RepID=UPI0011530F75|nr:hypothetical protein [Bosea sp. AK1]
MAAVDEMKRTTTADHAEGASLAPRRTGPVRGLLKLLVQADASHSKLNRLAAVLILAAAILASALFGYFLPKLLL